MNDIHSDALVFFGATGDLAYKKIFPALQAMVKRGNLDVPVIGVAKAGWNLDQLRARASDSLEKHGGSRPVGIRASCAACCGMWTATIRILRRSKRSQGTRLRAATRALSGDPARRCSEPSWSNWRSRVARKAHVSSSRNRSGPTSLRRGSSIGILLADLPETSDLPHRPLSGQAAGATTCCIFRFANSLPGAVLEPQPCRECADHDGGKLRRPGPGRVL